MAKSLEQIAPKALAGKPGKEKKFIKKHFVLGKDDHNYTRNSTHSVKFDERYPRHGFEIEDSDKVYEGVISDIRQTARNYFSQKPVKKTKKGVPFKRSKPTGVMAAWKKTKADNQKKQQTKLNRQKGFQKGRQTRSLQNTFGVQQGSKSRIVHTTRGGARARVRDAEGNNRDLHESVIQYLVEKGFWNGLKRSTRAKTKLGAAAAALATVGATTVAGAITGGKTFGPQGAAIGAAYSVANVLLNMRKKNKKQSSGHRLSEAHTDDQLKTKEKKHLEAELKNRYKLDKLEKQINRTERDAHNAAIKHGDKHPITRDLESVAHAFNKHYDKLERKGEKHEDAIRIARAMLKKRAGLSEGEIKNKAIEYEEKHGKKPESTRDLSKGHEDEMTSNWMDALARSQHNITDEGKKQVLNRMEALQKLKGKK